MERKVLIAGGSGMLGRHITQFLLQNEEQVAWLSRRQNIDSKGVKCFHWDPAKNEVDQEAIDWADHIINLAGESIGETRWTRTGKALIFNSRTEAVATLKSGLERRRTSLKSFVGVSGVGYYGPGNSLKTESDTAGIDFPAQVAKTWEEAYSGISPRHSEQKTIIRLAVVLSTQGGALPKIMQPIQFGAGAVLGSGLQPFPWIHLDDAAKAFVQALDWDGVVNVAAPDEVNNKTMTGLLAKVLHRPVWLPPVPVFALRLLLGERSELVTTGNRVAIQTLLEKGFTFSFPTFREAVEDLINRNL